MVNLLLRLPEKKLLYKYKYSADFLEESWSLGKTLNDILTTNQPRMQMTDQRITTLKAIFTDMKATNPKDRICTETAYDRILAIPLEPSPALRFVNTGQTVVPAHQRVGSRQIGPIMKLLGNYKII